MSQSLNLWTDGRKKISETRMMREFSQADDGGHASDDDSNASFSTTAANCEEELATASTHRTEFFELSPRNDREKNIFWCFHLSFSVFIRQLILRSKEKRKTKKESRRKESTDLLQTQYREEIWRTDSVSIQQRTGDICFKVTRLGHSRCHESLSTKGVQRTQKGWTKRESPSTLAPTWSICEVFLRQTTNLSTEQKQKYKIEETSIGIARSRNEVVDTQMTLWRKTKRMTDSTLAVVPCFLSASILWTVSMFPSFPAPSSVDGHPARSTAGREQRQKRFLIRNRDSCFLYSSTVTCGKRSQTVSGFFSEIDSILLLVLSAILISQFRRNSFIFGAEILDFHRL